MWLLHDSKAGVGVWPLWEIGGRDAISRLKGFSLGQVKNRSVACVSIALKESGDLLQNCANINGISRFPALQCL